MKKRIIKCGGSITEKGIKDFYARWGSLKQASDSSKLPSGEPSLSETGIVLDKDIVASIFGLSGKEQVQAENTLLAEQQPK